MWRVLKDTERDNLEITITESSGSEDSVLKRERKTIYVYAPSKVIKIRSLQLQHFGRTPVMAQC